MPIQREGSRPSEEEGVEGEEVGVAVAGGAGGAVDEDEVLA